MLVLRCLFKFKDVVSASVQRTKMFLSVSACDGEIQEAGDLKGRIVYQ